MFGLKDYQKYQKLVHNRCARCNLCNIYDTWHFYKTLDIVGNDDIVGNLEIVGNVDIVGIVDIVNIVDLIIEAIWNKAKALLKQSRKRQLINLHHGSKRC